MLATKIEDMKREEGFTLIELLVVVIIIGILAAIAIPAFLNQRESAWRSSAESDARNAAIGFETAYTRLRSAYPGTLDTAVPMDNTDGTAPIWYVTADGASILAATTAVPVPDTAIAEITISNGVALAYTNNDTAYSITAVHSQIAEGAEVVAWYDSDAGGIQTDLTGAPAAPALG